MYVPNVTSPRVYACTSCAGDCGAAILMYDGQLVGIHKMFVSALREHLERSRIINDGEPLTGVDGSLAALVVGAGQGTSVAVLASQFSLDAAAER